MAARSCNECGALVPRYGNRVVIALSRLHYGARAHHQHDISTQPSKLSLPRMACNIIHLFQCCIYRRKPALRISRLGLYLCEPSEHETSHVTEIAPARLFNSFSNLKNGVIAARVMAGENLENVNVKSRPAAEPKPQTRRKLSHRNQPI